MFASFSRQIDPPDGQADGRGGRGDGDVVKQGPRRTHFESARHAPLCLYAVVREGTRGQKAIVTRRAVPLN